ncbi:MAG TPA: hypothetical protein VE913_00175, partial [Longimicrobium sp.]|nr:hypothetical protein [Longimicrobium sp.]
FTELRAGKDLARGGELAVVHVGREVDENQPLRLGAGGRPERVLPSGEGCGRGRQPAPPRYFSSLATVLQG